MADKVTVKFTRAPYLIDRKGLTREDWASIGIDHDDVWFDRSNRYMVDASEFPEEVLDYFRNDPDFSISTADNPKAPRPAAVVASGPSGTDPTAQGFQDLDDNEPNAHLEAARKSQPVLDSSGEPTGRTVGDVEAESAASGSEPTTTLGGSTRTSGGTAKTGTRGRS